MILCLCPFTACILFLLQWFTSAPMCDAFLTLAKVAPDGSSSAAVAADPKVAPSCFLVPRWIPTTGERNSGFQVRTVHECVSVIVIMIYCSSHAVSSISSDNVVT